MQGHGRVRSGGSSVHAVPSRTVAFSVGLSVAVMAAAVAGCTSVPTAEQAATASAQTSASAGMASATINRSGAPVAVIDAGSPQAASLAVSRALFTSAPVVVVARAADASAVTLAGTHATRFGVPLLLIEDRAAPTDAVSAEITRLGARTVLALGTDLARELALPGVTVVTVPAKVPPVTRPPSASDVALLVAAGANGVTPTDPAASAASASAAAAGAHVVPVTGTDVRADPKAIEALSRQRPQRVLALGAGFGPLDRLTARLAVAATGTQLPGGGQLLFPGRRLVALYGHPGTPSLGALGEQGLAESIARAKKIAAEYHPLSSVPVVPTFEIIATTAQPTPGRDGDYSEEASVAELRPWVEQASAAGLYVVLDLQPGGATVLDQAKLYTDLLRLPHVGLAVDPEWKLRPGQRPLQQIGGVDAEEINAVIDWLADLTASEKLPQKLVVLHQFQLSMIGNEPHLKLTRDQVQVLIHMDGQGPPGSKDGTWASVTAAAPKGVPFGWKNFYDEDKPMLSPAQTMSKQPTPLMISYQ